MTLAQLRLLLGAYIVVVVFGFACDKLFPLPQSVKPLVPTFAVRGRPPSARALVYMVYGIAALVCGFVGMIGMFIAWRPSPLLFTIGIVAQMIPALRWYAMTAVDKFRAELELFLAGAISTVTLFGPAKHLFE